MRLSSIMLLWQPMVSPSVSSLNKMIQWSSAPSNQRSWLLRCVEVIEGVDENITLLSGLTLLSALLTPILLVLILLFALLRAFLVVGGFVFKVQLQGGANGSQVANRLQGNVPDRR